MGISRHKSLISKYEKCQNQVTKNRHTELIAVCLFA